MGYGDFVGMYDDERFVKVPVGPFIRERFYSGKSLLATFADFERQYGRYGFEKGECFNPLLAAAMIRRDWHQLKKLNYLPPDDGGVTLDILLTEENTSRGKPVNTTGESPAIGWYPRDRYGPDGRAVSSIH
jgi:hypothetical protein